LKKSEKNSVSHKPSLTAEARRDLREIQTYISEEQESPLNALKVIKAILGRVEKLLAFPNTGTLLTSKVNFPTNYRYARASGYLIFYRNEKEQIIVDRIIHGKRDYIKILFPEEDVQQG
jgi:plasmid stabilization system protein ParE